LKLAFVVQRYGADIAGGSEAHCRELARRLAADHDITVLTTCARDYVTWDNAVAPGETSEDGVRILRFTVEQQRRRLEFAELTDEVVDGATEDREEAWFHENGPVVPALLDHLRRQGTTYDLVLFWTFRYYPSFFGLPIVADRAILVPTAEEDRIVTLNVLERFFRLPAGYLFMTPEEEALVTARAGVELRPAATIGMGIDPAPPHPQGRALLEAHNIPSEFLLYLGRVDRNKGCETLLDYFQDYAARTKDFRWCSPDQQRCSCRHTLGSGHLGMCPTKCGKRC
jgi:glycosyltransferase involved in cell wall biosynthesis